MIGDQTYLNTVVYLINPSALCLSGLESIILATINITCKIQYKLKKRKDKKERGEYTLLTVKLIPRACGRWSKAICLHAHF